MRKIVTFLMVAVLVVSMLGLAVFAVDAPAMTAKAGAAVIDGRISDGEYGDALVLNSSNTISWNQGKLGFEVKYYFAWSEKAFDIAISVPKAKYKEGDTFQFSFNPGGLIIDTESGLFLSVIAGDGKVTLKQHNWSTTLEAKIEGEGVDVTAKMTSKVGTDGDNAVIEVSIPVDFFKISKSVNKTEVDSSAIKLEAGSMIANPFLVIDGKGYTTANCTGVTSGDWTIKGLHLGTVKLEAKSGSSSVNTPANNQNNSTTSPANNNSSNGSKTPNTTTFDLGIVSLAAIALSSAVAIKKRK